MRTRRQDPELPEYYARGYWRHEDLWHDFEERVAEHAEKPALVCGDDVGLHADAGCDHFRKGCGVAGEDGVTVRVEEVKESAVADDAGFDGFL